MVTMSDDLPPDSTPAAPRTIRLRTSRDGGYVFGDWRTQPLGATGSFLEPHVFRRLGAARHFTMEVSVISAAPVVLMAASAQVEPLGS